MIDFSIIQYILIFVFVSFAGFVDSIAGGGGLITIPTYIAMGVPAEFILGTNKLVSTSGGTITVFRYIRSGVIDFSVLIYGIITGVLGSMLGANLGAYLDSEKMTYILIVIVPFIFILNHIRSKISRDEDYSLSKKTLIIRCSIIGLVIGAYDGFFGPGTGTFLIVAMVLFMNMDLHKASSSARMINFTSNISAFVVFLTKGMIAWEVAGVAIVASLVGNYLGSGFVVKGNTMVIKKVFNFVLFALLAKSIYEIL
ncbi:sulfite exporter TauE/SafE family protein [Halobacteriovorax sp.]|uniref:sulfite exporter TauE/SafE family protein n=1 Tax=Halobacteriovorax sp. TaxID=2020862 RepID=UPI0035633C89